MPARHARGQRALERLDHCVDHSRERRRIHEHGRGRVGADQSALRQHELDRPERAVVRHLVGTHEIFEGDARDGLAAAVVAGIDRALRLRGDVGVIDSQLVALDDHFDDDRHQVLAA
jgi:hypothetical protein